MGDSLPISVVVPAYNAAAFLAEALASGRAQTRPAAEVIVVDNGSTDASQAIAQALGLLAHPDDLSLRGPAGQEHRPNTASTRTGEFLAFTDDDCRPEPTWLQDIVDCVRRWDADGVGGRILPEWSAPPPPWLATDRHLWTTIAMLDDSEVRRVEMGPWQRANGFRVWGANMAFRRSAFDAVGGFNPASGPRGLKKYSHEEIELVRKLVEAGKVVMYDPAPTVHHWVSAERLRKSFYRWHSFYYGEGSAFRSGPPNSRHLLGIPPFLIRAFTRNVFAWIGAALRRDPESFCQEREIHESIGYLSGYMKCAFRAGQYARLRKVPMPDPGFENRVSQ
jgi:GT2 family glycosyltransferase